MRRVVQVLGMLLVAFACVHASSSHAQNAEADTAEAERLFAAGDQAYEAGKYLAAAGAYERAYTLHPVPSITFSIAQAYRRHYFEDQDAQWLVKAQELYQRYLKEQPTGGRRAHAVTHLNNIAVLLAGVTNQADPNAPPVAAVRTEVLIASTVPTARATIDDGDEASVPVVQLVTPGPHRIRVTADGYLDYEIEIVASEGRLSVVPTELKPRPGVIRISSLVDGAQIWIDGEQKGVAGAPIEVTPGRHTIAVAAPGRDLFARSLVFEPGEQQTLSVHLPTSTQRTAAYVSFVGAGGFTALGLALAIVAGVAEQNAIAARAGLDEGRALTPDEAARSNSDLELRNLSTVLSATSFGVGGAAGLTGALLFTFDRPVPSEAGAGSPTGASLGWSAAF